MPKPIPHVLTLSAEQRRLIDILVTTSISEQIDALTTAAYMDASERSLAMLALVLDQKDVCAMLYPAEGQARSYHDISLQELLGLRQLIADPPVLCAEAAKALFAAEGSGLLIAIDTAISAPVFGTSTGAIIRA
jgi:hypothetical protein